MEHISYKGLEFEPYIKNEEIQKEVKRVASEITRDCGNEKPLFLCVLNGAFIFAADLFRSVDFESEISFIRYKSYSGMSSTGEVKEVLGLTESIEGRTVIIVEDIVDTGNTIMELKDIVMRHGASDAKVCTMLLKPEVYKKDAVLDYVAMEIPDKFIVGFGLDYNQLGRNNKDIFVLDTDE